MFERFTDKAVAVIMYAQQEARRLGQAYVGSELLLIGLIGEGTSIAATVLIDLGLTLQIAQAEVEKIIGRGSGLTPPEIPFTPRTKQLLEQAVRESQQLKQNYTGPEHLLLALVINTDNAAVKVLRNLGISLDEVKRQILQAGGEVAIVTPIGRGRPRQAGHKPGAILAEFAIDLTQQAAEGKIDPVVGRQKEIERVIQILGRRTKNNPVLIGEPGVGKTAIAEGLAQRIIDQDVPELLLDQQVFSLSMSTLVAGTRFRGDFEERITLLLDEVRQAGNIILVIDEIHTLVGTGSLEGGTDAANLFKPALARGELQCVGATTLDEYRKHIEKDAALERRFQPVMVGEPSVEETIEILNGLRSRYEDHHRLTIADEALKAAAILSDRYISDRFLPDKAIDLIDEAGSRVRFRHAKPSPTKERKQALQQVRAEKTSAVDAQDFDRASELRDQELELESEIRQLRAEADTSENPKLVVDADDIAQVVSAWTGIPVNRMQESEAALLMHLEDTLHERLIGQEEAVEAVARAVRRARVGLKNPNRPIASFIFSGPTGVGKTELTKALAASVFGSEEAMIRLDMSEYMERYSVSKLTGSPPGYVGYNEGGQLTEAVRRRPYSIVLFDEIEKAHPDIFNILLQILEDGRLTDSQGRVVDFKNTILILTSNIGSRAIEKGGDGLGFNTEMDFAAVQYKRIRDQVNDALKERFRPEFLNRLDDIIVFRQLTRHEVKQIADLLIQEITDRLQEQEIGLEVTESFKDRLVIEGYDPSYGARPLRRAISRLLEDHLAEAILSHRIQAGDTAVFDIDADNQVQVEAQRSPALVGVNS